MNLPISGDAFACVIDFFPSLVHLHLTFSGVVCLLSLQGRQEQCSFSTRLRVLKSFYAVSKTNRSSLLTPDTSTTGVPYVLKLSGMVPPQYTPRPRSVFLQVIGSQSGAKMR